MYRLILFLSFVIIYLGLSIGGDLAAQPFDKNDTRIKYLERKLTFNYYNASQGMWWINTFKYNPDDGTFKFKSISAENPGKILGKKYTDRIFALADLNPYLITISRIQEDQGYLVKGDLLRIETIKHQNLVRKYINTASATPQSYIHFVIPDYLMDSTVSLTDSIKVAFESLILNATALSRLETSEGNAQLILETMLGEFAVGDTKRFVERMDAYKLSFEEYLDRNKIRSGFFGYNPQEDTYYEIVIDDEGDKQETRYRVDTSETKLAIVGIEEPDKKYVFENKSKILYYEGGIEVEYRPSRSF